jgi:acyl carrier protein
MSNTTLEMSPAEIQPKVIQVLEEMTMDWDVELEEGWGDNTRLIDDLAFESIDIVRFVVAIEQAFAVKGLPFEKLFMREGEYVDEMSVSEVTGFLHENLGLAQPAA